MPYMTRSRQAQAANAGSVPTADAQLPPPLDIPAPSHASRPPTTHKRKRPTQSRNDGLSAFPEEVLCKALEVPQVRKIQRHILPKDYQLKFNEPSIRPSTKFPTATVQFRTESAVASVSFVDLPGQERGANSRRPPDSAVIIFADEPGRHSGSSSTKQKHSLRLVRGTSSHWTVVPPADGIPAPLQELPLHPLTSPYVSTTRKGPLRKSPVQAKKPVTKETGKGSPKKKKRRLGETVLGRRSSSSESFHSEVLGTDEPSLSASSNEDSRADAPPSTSNGDSQGDPNKSQELVSRVPTYSAAQKEAMSTLFHNDASLAERMTSLKEWALSESAKLLQTGRLRQSLKAAASEVLSASSTESISVDTVDLVRETVRNKLAESEDMNELKRRLCIQIIRSRQKDYSVYSDPVKPQLIL